MGSVVLISLFSPKGGVGVSTCSALFAKALSKYHSTLLIEATSGDLDAIVATDTSANYSFFDWVVSDNPSIESLKKISIGFDEKLSVVVGDTSKNPITDEYHQRQVEFLQNTQFDYGHIVEELSSYEGHCVVDCSNAESMLTKEIIRASDLVVMVLRQCYLGLHKASKSNVINDVDVTVVVKESGRSISASQISQTLNCNILIEIDARSDFARSIDSGTLWSRTPEKMVEPINRYIQDLLEIQNRTGVAKDIFQDSSNANQFNFWSEESSNDLKFSTHIRHLLNGGDK